MVDMIRSLCSLIFAILMMYTFLDCRIKEKRNQILYIIFISLIVIIDVIILVKFGYTNFRKFYPIFVQIPLYLAFVFISKFNFIKVFFVLSTAIAITASFTLAGIIISFFFKGDMSVMYFGTYLMYIPSWILVHKYMRPSVLYMLNNTDKGWIGFCIIPLAYNVLVFTVSNYRLDNIDLTPMFRSVIFIAILTISAYALILRYFKQTREQLTLQNEQNLLQMQVNAAQTNLESLKDSQEKTMIYRHDMRHHLNLIDAYLSEDNKDAARKYIAEIGKSIDDITVIKYCTNYSVNLIISSYVEKAKKEHIHVQTQIDIPQNHKISDMDLCIFFSNALENAINACKFIQDLDKRNLKIHCDTRNKNLVIQITNSFEGTVTFANNLPISEDENHGFGTKSIAAIAEKYNGLYSFSSENGIFKTSIVL